MPSIDEIMKKRQERQDSQPAYTGGIDLMLRDDKTKTSVAMAVAHSLYSGQEGDPYMEYYIGHAYDGTSKNGKRFTNVVFCPVQSGFDENYPCEGCKNDVPTKDRFAMWFYVYEILYNTLLPNESHPPKLWTDGNTYFSQQVNAVRFWDTSAWVNSPLGDIKQLAGQLKDLRLTRVTLKSTGTELEKRYKFYPEMGSPAIDPALYEKCRTEIKPVLQVLYDRITGTPTVQAPPTQQAQTPAPSATLGDAVPPEVTTPAPQLPAFEAPANPPQDLSVPPTLPPFKAPDKPEGMF